MSLENARAAYPILVQLARTYALAAQERRNLDWCSYDDFCAQCRDAGVKETPRTVATKLLKPLQALCLEYSMPDLSALVIQKPKARSDFGNLIRPADIWWEIYVEREGATVGDVKFWFEKYRTARDFDAWPETPFFEESAPAQ